MNFSLWGSCKGREIFLMHKKGEDIVLSLLCV